MLNGTAGCIDKIRIGHVLARFRMRIFLRMTAFHITHTLTGKFGAASIVIMAAIMVTVAVGGFLGSLPASDAALDGFLLAAHIWLAVSLSLMILVQFTKAFIKQRESEPLLSYPAIHAALARNRVYSSVPLVSFTFTALFFAYFWQLFPARLTRLWLSIPIHLFTTAMLVLAAAAVIGWVGRRLLRAMVRRGIRNADVLVNSTGVFSMFAFCVMLLAIILANEYAVGVFETVGNSAAVKVPFGMIPFAAALAADEGRWLATLFWLGLSAALALWAVRAIYRWSFSAHREIPTDLATPLNRVYAPVFTGQSARLLPRGMTAFWRKDIVVPYSREPKRYLFHQVNLLWWGIMATILAMALRNRGNITSAFADTIPVVMTLFAMAVYAMQNGVNALGREGRELTWLRPIFAGRQLFGRKLLVNLCYVLVHGIVYAFIVSAASRATSLSTSFWTLAAYASGAGGVFACLATSVGFLFPDFERRSSSLPGSTTVGKGAYLTGVLILVNLTGAAHLLLAAGMFDGPSYVGLVCFAIVCAAVAFAATTAVALRQYRGMEI